MPFARITGFTTSRLNSAGRVDLPWDKPGDALPLALDIDTDDVSRVRAEVWTNVDQNGTPDAFHAVPMKLAPSSPSSSSAQKARFELDLPVHKIGNYRAVARVSVDDGKTWQWMSQSGIADLRFRPRDERHDQLAIEEVSVGNVNFDAVKKLPGTFADLMAPASQSPDDYTLSSIKKRGINALWIIPPFEIYKWDGRPAVDDAGSPYAVKDYFSIRTELSRDARAVLARGGSHEEARQAALDEFKRFVKDAHRLGVQVFLDVALNHVGKDYEFRDLFVTRDANGREVREVRRNDFAQVVINPDQLKTIQQKIDDPTVPDYMEHLAPWMYGDKQYDPHGARTADDVPLGGWWEWADTAQLNHGRVRVAEEEWRDGAATRENDAVQAYLERVLRFWAVDMGVDGFRFDHLTGLPASMLEGALNRVQADVDAHAPRGEPARSLFYFGEDFHTAAATRHFLDAGQGSWFRELLGARTPRDFERILDDPWFHDLLAVSSHDEMRPIVSLHDNHQAAARLESLLQLFGGPVATVAGDNLAERMKIPFKQYRGITALRAAGAAAKAMATIIDRAGQARASTAALQDDNRAWLRPKSGGADAALLALGRFSDDEESRSFVIANMSNADTRENVFDVGSMPGIDSSKKYVVRDLMSDDPSQSLWPRPLSGRDLLDRGLFVRLAPYQVQVLSLDEV